MMRGFEMETPGPTGAQRWGLASSSRGMWGLSCVKTCCRHQDIYRPVVGPWQG